MQKRNPVFGKRLLIEQNLPVSSASNEIKNEKLWESNAHEKLVRMTGNKSVSMVQEKLVGLKVQLNNNPKIYMNNCIPAEINNSFEYFLFYVSSVLETFSKQSIIVDQRNHVNLQDK
ncbi:unnamed protein product [Schistosoma turkestanicum]|nr:unnamed protein product [Schistosoma turkestanicum]